MPAPQTGYITANSAGFPLQGRASGRSTLPITFVTWGVFGGATVKLQAGFLDANNIMQWNDVGAPSTMTAAGMTNVNLKSNAFQLVVTGATGTTNVGWWFG